MTVDFRSVVFAKGEKAQETEDAAKNRRSAELLLLAVIVGVVWGLFTVAVIWG